MVQSLHHDRLSRITHVFLVSECEHMFVSLSYVSQHAEAQTPRIHVEALLWHMLIRVATLQGPSSGHGNSL